MLDCNHLRREIQIIFQRVFSQQDFVAHLQIEKKLDRSQVTSIDLEISTLFKQYIAQNAELKNLHFISEEDLSELRFPCLVIDPIDGTKSLVKGVHDCAVSVAILPSPVLQEISLTGKNIQNFYAWIYNPFTGFDLHLRSPFTAARSVHKGVPLGMVSRSEWNAGTFHYPQQEMCLVPKGSIAFKLGLLAAGACDFVVSMQGKNIWDIAAGTLLCRQRGLHFYDDKGEILTLDRESWQAPLYWCLPTLYPFLRDKINYARQR